MKIRFIVLVTSFLLLLVGGPAGADTETEYAPMNGKFQFYLGGFFPDVTSKISINGTELPDNPVLDFEDVFGLEDSKTVLWGGVRWRISRRNHLEFEFADLNRNGSVTAISEPVEVGGSLIQVGARVDSAFDVTIGRLTYGFSLVRTDRMDIQLKAGLHIADLGVSLQAYGEVCEPGETPPCSIFSGATPRAESEDVTAPLPHLGGSFMYGITPTIVARLQIIGFAMELNDIDGSVVELDADVIWQPWGNFGIGAGLRYFEVDLENNGSKLNGSFNFEYAGPAIFAVLTF